jgi:hypothetical protein
MSTERVLDRVSQDYEEWARALSREKGEMDYRSDMNNSRREGYEQGREEAIQKLRELGVSEEIITAGFQNHTKPKSQ